MFSEHARYKIYKVIFLHFIMCLVTVYSFWKHKTWQINKLLTVVIYQIYTMKKGKNMAGYIVQFVK